MKLIKKTILVLASVFLVLLVGLSIFVYTFDANHYKPQISDQVEKATGRKLSIEGDVKLSLFPWIGLSLGRVTLANAQGFGPDPFAKLQALDVKVALMPLLKQQLKVDKVRLQGLYVSLQQSKDGRNNWMDLNQSPRTESPDKAPQPGQTQAAKPAKDYLAALLVNGVEIKDATLIWQDELTGVNAKLDQIRLETGAIRMNEIIPLSVSVHAALNQPQLDVVLAINSDVRFQPDSMLADLKNLLVTLNVKSDELPAQSIEVRLESSLQARLNQQQFDIGQTRLRLAAKGKGLPTGAINAELNTAANIDLQAQTAQLDSLILKTMGAEIQARIAVRGLMSDPVAQGQIKLLPINLKSVSQQLGIDLPEMQNAKALSHLALSSKFQASPSFAQLDQLSIELDRSVIKGGFRAKEFHKPNLSFHLSMDQLILDDYLSPASALAASSAPAPVPVPVAQEDVVIELPIELLRSLQADGQFVLQQMQAFNHKISNISIGLKASQGQLRLPASMKLLQGSLAVSAGLDVRPATPKYKVQLTGQGLQAASVINPMLKNILGDDSMTMDGALQMSADINSRGGSVNNLLAASNGKLRLNMSKAELKGVDAEFFVRKAVVDYMEQKNIATQPEWRGTYNPKQTTAFSLARASATITDGVIDNRDLLLDSKRLKVTGAGKIDLPKQLINYRAVVDLDPAHRDSTLEKMLDIPVPLDVKGNFSSPDISMDSKTWGKQLGDLFKQEAKAKIQREADEKLDEKKEELKDKLKNKLEGLFKR